MDERERVGARYAEHLTDRDLLALSGERADQIDALRRHPVLVLDLLDRPSVADAVLRAGHDDAERFRNVSPFLVFAAAVHRAAGALVGRSHVPDRVAPRSRLPVFDGPALAAFAAEPAHRLFLAELLASYARLGSGVVWRRSGDGRPRRQRWDELDLPRMLALLEDTPAEQQPGVWRRIGDGALFLAAVFPEYAERTLGERHLARLSGGAPADGPVAELLESLAGRAYARAGAAVPQGISAEPRSARRVLSLVADGYLYPTGAPY